MLLVCGMLYKITSTSIFGDGRISTHVDPTSTCRAVLIGTRLRLLFLPELYFRVGGRFLWLWASVGAKFPKCQNGRFPAPDAREPPCKIWRCWFYPGPRNA